MACTDVTIATTFVYHKHGERLLGYLVLLSLGSLKKAGSGSQERVVMMSCVSYLIDQDTLKYEERIPCFQYMLCILAADHVCTVGISYEFVSNLDMERASFEV